MPKYEEEAAREAGRERIMPRMPSGEITGQQDVRVSQGQSTRPTESADEGEANEGGEHVAGVQQTDGREILLSFTHRSEEEESSCEEWEKFGMSSEQLTICLICWVTSMIGYYTLRVLWDFMIADVWN